MALSPACDYITCVLLPYHLSLLSLSVSKRPIPNAVTAMNIALEANRLFFRQTEPGLRLKINSNWVVCCTPALPQAPHAGKTAGRAVFALPVSPQSAT